MNIRDKIELVGYLAYIKDIAYWEDLDMIEEKTDKLLNDDEILNEYSNILHMKREKLFFDGLSMQTELDNVLSLMKICKRLNVEAPKIQINMENIKETYDEFWDCINEQIPISDRLIKGIKNIAKEVMDMELKIEELVDDFTFNDIMSRTDDIIGLQI